MGVTINGQICYGILFEDRYEFPWDSEDDFYLEDWWCKSQGYKSLYEPFTPEGEWAEGYDESSDLRDYHDHYAQWKREHPIPVKEVNCCSGDYPIIILAIPSTVMWASCGYPQEFEPITELIIDSLHLSNFKTFFTITNLEWSEPKWYLSSYTD